jgi:hypothetical protein
MPTKNHCNVIIEINIAFQYVFPLARVQINFSNSREAYAPGLTVDEWAGM